jgi:hypothetical protein
MGKRVYEALNEMKALRAAEPTEFAVLQGEGQTRSLGPGQLCKRSNNGQTLVNGKVCAASAGFMLAIM